jgi:hypothetical protein
MQSTRIFVEPAVIGYLDPVTVPLAPTHFNRMDCPFLLSAHRPTWARRIQPRLRRAVEGCRYGDQASVRSFAAQILQSRNESRRVGSVTLVLLSELGSCLSFLG